VCLRVSFRGKKNEFLSGEFCISNSKSRLLMKRSLSSSLLSRASKPGISFFLKYTGTAEVSSILEDRILGSTSAAEVQETGRVLSIGDGIARVYGLKNVQAEEMVEFSSGIKVFF
jgi:F-type H+-transporting ATPase subunit alpha